MPCVIALPIVTGNAAYLEWLGHQTCDTQNALAEQHRHPDRTNESAHVTG